jgi:hypothetical protein
MKTIAAYMKTTTTANVSVNSASTPCAKKQWVKPEIILIDSGNVETGHTYSVHESIKNSGGVFYHS